mmetsp:Transcript_80456/g.93887  ORF Transcript_80456/g.93887 Transcript_80456/m.93887 type:complete len:163 (+) Transcript_80456:68-556(+)|eukprot:CAMPEP_0176423812 /NCGR_PEP_ID=MMETSP0127-20121128/10493_1 /TAXON_ID=938130 /ORGANISM="Platyophrya macrostoma, Strain WH" /LENGTH=162 /DNA_ID=CAMNT_0017804807 /DNA_START=63 /DNA_END=551 /DNA_ORIENTATION=-
MNQTIAFTRSKSEDQFTSKSKVLSPTPIRENSLLLINQILEFSSAQNKLNFDAFEDSENTFTIRKFQSLDVYEMYQLYRSKHPETGLEFDDTAGSDNANMSKVYGSGNSGYFVSEIPTRASNPLIYDARFMETETLNSYGTGVSAAYMNGVENGPSSRLEAY